MKHIASTALILGTLLVAAPAFTSPALAQESSIHADDSVTFTVSAEDWVTTKTARVTVNVEAAVSDKNAGSMRGEMTKTVAGLAKGDWRITSFNRSMDQTGLERWSAQLEARLEEGELNGLAEAAKKASKAGMQLSVSDIDFTPTLDETEAAKAALRTKIYKQVNDQLASLNTTLPGRNYRIAGIGFASNGMVAMPMANRGVMMKAMTMAAPAAPQEEDVERAQKITMTATVTLSALVAAAK